MLRAIPPTRALQGKSFGSTCFLVAFVKDSNGIYDSIEAGARTKSTLMFKLLTICGKFLQGSWGKSKSAWIEETRSTPISGEEKTTLLKALDDGKSSVAKDAANLTAIGIEFRMSGND